MEYASPTTREMVHSACMCAFYSGRWELLQERKENAKQHQGENGDSTRL